jgi:hypothetical protein
VLSVHPAGRSVWSNEVTIGAVRSVCTSNVRVPALPAMSTPLIRIWWWPSAYWFVTKLNVFEAEHPPVQVCVFVCLSTSST